MLKELVLYDMRYLPIYIVLSENSIINVFISFALRIYNKTDTEKKGCNYLFLEYKRKSQKCAIYCNFT